MTLQPNQTPFYDGSVNTTGCCARFNPAGWEGERLHFDAKPFVRAHTRSIAHFPVNMGTVFGRVQDHVSAADAEDKSQMFVMSRDLSAFSGEHLFAVTGPVPGEEMTTLSGDFLTRCFEGPYGQVRTWYGEMQTAAREAGHDPGEVWFFYTTCPKCARAYGQNPVVGVVELKPR